jgi:hypothetical protein
MDEKPEGSNEAPPEVPAVWYVAIGDEKRGPMTLTQLIQLFDSGAANNRSLVWKKGTPSWLMADQVPEVAQCLSGKTISRMLEKGKSLVDSEGGKATKGFFRDLFDPTFNTLITTRIIRVVYLILLALVGVVMLCGSVFAIYIESQQSLSAGIGRFVLCLILTPLLFLVYSILIRVWCECLVVIFKISENISEIANQGKKP